MDAPAAYLASLGGCATACRELDPHPDNSAGQCRVAPAAGLLRSEAEAGARAWLAAVPAGRKRTEAAAFTMELRQRLGVADAAADIFCPCCEEKQCQPFPRFFLADCSWSFIPTNIMEYAANEMAIHSFTEKDV